LSGFKAKAKLTHIYLRDIVDTDTEWRKTACKSSERDRFTVATTKRYLAPASFAQLRRNVRS